MHDHEKTTVSVFKALAHYVDKIADGNVALIWSSDTNARGHTRLLSARGKVGHIKDDKFKISLRKTSYLFQSALI